MPDDPIASVKHLGGLDLAKVADYAAFVVPEVHTYALPNKPKVEAVDPALARDPQKLAESLSRKPPKVSAPKRRYLIRYAERYERGTPYHRIADDMVDWYSKPPLQGSPLVIDWGGVGEAVLEIIVKAFADDRKRGGVAKARIVPVRITTGQAATFVGRGWHVAKEELVGVLMALFNNGQLEFSLNRVPQSGVIKRELETFTEKKTKAGNSQFEADRPSDHDDLVMALALSAWYNERARQEIWVKC